MISFSLEKLHFRAIYTITAFEIYQITDFNIFYTPKSF